MRIHELRVNHRCSVSVITAVRNGSGVLRATLDSVANQSYSNIEHIVVDGASTDGTIEIVRQAGKRVAVLVSEPDQGVYDAFNKGLRLATGDVVAYLNAGDTYVGADAVAALMENFLDKTVGASFADVGITDPADGRVLRHYRSSRFRPAMIPYGFMPAHPTLFVRREVYGRVGGYDPSFRIGGDFEFVARAFGRFGIRYRYVPRMLVRMPRGGLSTAGWRTNLLITREMYRACRMNGITTGWMQLSLRFPIKLTEHVVRDS